MPSDSSGADRRGEVDLDALIGDARFQAARRRAAPDFPVDEEARLGIELDRLAPAPQRPRLERLADVIDALGRSEPVASGRVRRLAPRGGPKERLVEMAAIVSEALRHVSRVTADLEHRLERIERSEFPAPGLDSGRPDGLGEWSAEVAAIAARAGSRVLCWGREADDWAASLEQVSVDAYAVQPPGQADDDLRSGDDGRSEDLAEHLRRVGPDRLGMAVIIGPEPEGGRPDLLDLAGRLARVTPTVCVVSEARWWWSQRLDPAVTELAGRRPLSAETWMSILDQAGFSCSARYGRDGRSYLVEATRRA